MLVNGLRAAAGLALAGGCKTLPCQKPHAKVCGGGFKIGVCDWSVGLVAEPSAFEVIKRLGADGVQVDFGMADDDLPILHKAGMRQKYMELPNQYDLEIASFGMVALGWAPYRTDPRWEQWLGEGIEASKAFGVKVVLVPFFGKPDLSEDAESRAIVTEKFKKMAPKAEKAGVVLGIESWMSAEQNLEIIEKVGSPAVKMYYDVGNSHKKGYDIYKEIRVLGKQICQFHAKDYGNDEFGKGNIDFKRVREAMDEIGYRGWFVFESNVWEPKKPISPQQEAVFAKNVEYLRSIFPRKV
jgi:sugar phosphate isomerase/epimerase